MARILTTVPHDFAALTPARLEWWRERADVIDRRTLSRAALVRRLVRDAGRYDALLLDGSVGTSEWYSDLLAALGAKLARRRTAIVITDASWKRGGSLPDRIACRLGLEGLDSGHVTYCVLSSDELALFPRTWKVDPERVVFTPFCLTFTDEDLAAPTSEAGGVFAGGDSLRDYAPLVAAARRIDAPMTIATSTLAHAEVPPTVRAGRLSHETFNDALRAASVVVVPMQAAMERSAGQQTYLNAMAIGKLVVVTDSPGARDYVRDGETGMIVPPADADALTGALRWALDPANAAAVAGMRRRAREDVLARFSLDAYFERLVSVVEERM